MALLSKVYPQFHEQTEPDQFTRREQLRSGGRGDHGQMDLLGQRMRAQAQERAQPQRPAAVGPVQSAAAPGYNKNSTYGIVLIVIGIVLILIYLADLYYRK